MLERQKAKKAVTTSLLVAVPLNFLLFAFGTVLFLFYRSHPGALNPSMKTDGVFALFVAQQLPAGLSGLVVAGLLAAAMGPLSAGIHSVANLGVEDFYRRLRKNAGERSCMILARCLTIVLGLLGTGAALWMARSTAMSIWDVAMATTALITNPIIGIFVLGLFTRRANSGGVVIGVLSSMAAVFYLKSYTPVTFFLYVPIGTGICVLIGYLCSFILPGRQRDMSGLTIYTLPKPESEESPIATPLPEPVLAR